jgi:DNA-directed RNA polymerase sigma subunit (sigma70/sigma32)
MTRYPTPYGSQKVCAIRHESTDPRKHDALSHLTDFDVTTLPAASVDVAESELVAKLLTEIALLAPVTRRVMDARLDGLTLGEVGALIGRSRERVRQIEREGVVRVRDRLGRFVADVPGEWWSGGVWEAM